MTTTSEIRRMPQKHRKFYIKTAVSAAGALFFAVLLLCFPEPGTQGVREGLSLCARALIPSVFPFLVLTPFLAGYGQRVPGIPVLFPVFFIGMTAGFPLGAVTAASLYRSGALDRDTAERALAVCSASGPAFLIGCAGKALGGSAAVGWCYCFGQTAAALLLYFLFLSGKRGSRAVPPSPIPTLPASVSEAAGKTVTVCAFVVFFSCISRFLTVFLEKFSVPPFLSALLCGSTELTCGLSLCSSFAGGAVWGTPYFPLSAFLIGFGGLSFALQARVFAERAGLSVRYWVPVRLLYGIFCTVFSCIAALLFL